MVAARVQIVIGSGRSDAGWSVAARSAARGCFVLCQGHPEYGTLSLLREYRRDVRRYLFGRGAVPYPRAPESYFGPEALATLDGFERRARMSTDDPLKLWERFPYDDLATSIENSWVAASTAFYANWLGLASESSPRISATQAPSPRRRGSGCAARDVWVK